MDQSRAAAWTSNRARCSRDPLESPKTQKFRVFRELSGVIAWREALRDPRRLNRRRTRCDWDPSQCARGESRAISTAPAAAPRPRSGGLDRCTTRCARRTPASSLYPTRRYRCTTRYRRRPTRTWSRTTGIDRCTTRPRRRTTSMDRCPTRWYRCTPQEVSRSTGPPPCSRRPTHCTTASVRRPPPPLPLPRAGSANLAQSTFVP